MDRGEVTPPPPQGVVPLPIRRWGGKSHDRASYRESPAPRRPVPPHPRGWGGGPPEGWWRGSGPGIGGSRAKRWIGGRLPLHHPKGWSPSPSGDGEARGMTALLPIEKARPLAALCLPIREDGEGDHPKGGGGVAAPESENLARNDGSGGGYPSTTPGG